MKHIVTFLFFSLSTFATTIMNCHNHAPRGGVSFSYENCVNRNFRQINWELELPHNHCVNYGNTVNPNFTYCIERNFERIEREIDSFYLRWCQNYGPTLSYIFQSCVNDNFRKIDRALK